jgi:G:T/U-mismatch repair DNA glycosylase
MSSPRSRRPLRRSPGSTRPRPAGISPGAAIASGRRWRLRLTPVQPIRASAELLAPIGITNTVAATAAELTAAEIRAGRPGLERKVRRYRPRAVAIVGIGAYRIAFDRPRATFGRQPEDLAGALLWVLPNTSGLNAHYQAAGFARAFAELRAALDARPRS